MITLLATWTFGVTLALVALGVAAEDGFPTHRFPVDRILRTV